MDSMPGSAKLNDKQEPAVFGNELTVVMRYATDHAERLKRSTHQERSSDCKLQQSKEVNTAPGISQRNVCTSCELDRNLVTRVPNLDE